MPATLPVKTIHPKANSIKANLKANSNTPTKLTPSKVSTVEWIIIVTALGIIDLSQLIIDLFAIGIAVNRLLDIVVGGLLIVYLWIRGELKDPQTRNRIVFAFCAAFVTEEIPLLDAAPAWILDGLYSWHLSRQRNERAKAQRDQEKAEVKQKVLVEKNIQLNQFKQKQRGDQEERVGMEQQKEFQTAEIQRSNVQNTQLQARRMEIMETRQKIEALRKKREEKNRYY